MTTRRDPNTRTVVRIPEQALNERVIDLAIPLLERLGTVPDPEAIRAAIELTIAFWNAKARASKFWGGSRNKPLNDLTRKMTGKKASADDVQAFALLTKRWHDKEIAFDPRLIGDWSLEVSNDGAPRLSCAMQLPDGVEAEIPPPIEKRVAIAGKFLDETQIQMAGTPGTMLLSFPVQEHRGAVHDNGTIAVHTKMPTAIALFAEGVLPPVGGASVALTVQGKKLESMVLSEVRCGGNGGHNDIAILIFKPASPSAAMAPRA